MITKGVLKSIDFNSNKCLVRLPLFETSINNELVYEATFSITPGIYNGYEVGDVVWVCFENGHMDTPVVVGKLYLGVNKESAQPRGVVNCKESIVSETAKIPVDTSLSSSTDKDIVDNKTPYKSLASVSSSLAALGENVGAMDLTYGNKFESVITDIGGLSSEIKQTATDISMKVDNKQSETSFGWALTDSDWTIYRTGAIEEAEAKKNVQCTFFKIQKYNADLDETYDEWHLLINGCDTGLTQAKVMDGYTDTAAKFLSDLVKNICSDTVPRLDIISGNWVIYTTNNIKLTPNPDISITNAAVLKANQDGLTVYGTIKATDGDIGRFIIGKSHNCTVENVHNGQASGIYSYGYYNSYEGTLDDTEKGFEQKGQKKYTQTIKELYSCIDYSSSPKLKDEKRIWDRFFNNTSIKQYNTSVKDNSNGVCTDLYEKLVYTLLGANIANQLESGKYIVSLVNSNVLEVTTYVTWKDFFTTKTSDNVLEYNKKSNKQQIENIFSRFSDKTDDDVAQPNKTWSNVVCIKHRVFDTEANKIKYITITDKDDVVDGVGDSDGDGWYLYCGSDATAKDSTSVAEREYLIPLITSNESYFLNVLKSKLSNDETIACVNYIERVPIQGVYVGTDGIRLGKDLRLGLDGTVYYKKLQYIGTDQKGDVRPNLQSGNSKYGSSVLINTYSALQRGSGKYAGESQKVSDEALTKDKLIKYSWPEKDSYDCEYYTQKAYSDGTYFLPISYSSGWFINRTTSTSCLLLPKTGQKLEAGKQYVISFSGKITKEITQNIILGLSLRYTYTDTFSNKLAFYELEQDPFIEDTLSWKTYPNNQDGQGVGGKYNTWTTFWYKFSTPSKEQFPDWKWENIQNSRVAICATAQLNEGGLINLPDDCYFLIKEIKLEEIPDGDTVAPSAFCYSSEDTLGGNGKGIAGADNLSQLTEAEWTAYTEGNTHKITLNKGFNIGDFVIISGVATDSGDTHTLFGEVISKILRDDSKWETGVNVQSHTVQKKGAQGEKGNKGNDGVGTSLVVIYRASAASALSGDSVVPSMNGTTTLDLKSADGGTWSAEPLTPTSSNPYVYATTYLAVVTNGTTKYYCNDKTKHTAEVVKYATLDSLISILSDGDVNLITKTIEKDKVYYSLNADRISGAIEGSVEIAGFKVTSNKLYAPKDATEPFGIDGTVMMCTGSTESKSIGGSGDKTGWCFTAGSKFGVTNKGELYSSSCNISGGSLKISSDAADRYVQINSNGLNINGVSIGSYKYGYTPSQGISDYTAELSSGKTYTITRPNIESYDFSLNIDIRSSAGTINYSVKFPAASTSINVDCAVGPASASSVTVSGINIISISDPLGVDVLTVNGQKVIYGSIDLKYNDTTEDMTNGVCLNGNGWYTGFNGTDKKYNLRELKFVNAFPIQCNGVVASFMGNDNHTWFTTALRDITKTGFCATGWSNNAHEGKSNSDYPTKVFYYAWGI